MVWLIPSLAKFLLSFIVGFDSSHNMWDVLAKMFEFQYWARLLWLWTELQFIRHNMGTLPNCIKKTKVTTNNMAAIRHPVNLFHKLGASGACSTRVQVQLLCDHICRHRRTFYWWAFGMSHGLWEPLSASGIATLWPVLSKTKVSDWSGRDLAPHNCVTSLSLLK